MADAASEPEWDADCVPDSVAEAPEAVREGAVEALRCCETVIEVELVGLGVAQGDGEAPSEAETCDREGEAEQLSEGEGEKIAAVVLLTECEQEGDAESVTPQGEEDAGWEKEAPVALAVPEATMETLLE